MHGRIHLDENFVYCVKPKLNKLDCIFICTHTFSEEELLPVVLPPSEQSRWPRERACYVGCISAPLCLKPSPTHSLQNRSMSFQQAMARTISDCSKIVSVVRTLAFLQHYFAEMLFESVAVQLPGPFPIFNNKDITSNNKAFYSH